MTPLRTLTLLATAALLAACAPAAPKTATAPPTKAETVFAVNTTKVVSGELKSYLRVNADVRNTSSVDVVPETAGKVVKLNVVLGSVVTQGQVVAEVDPSKPGMEFVASPVKAPISGTVVAVPASLGATVSPQVPIIRISRGTETKLVADIAEKYIASIQTGLTGQAQFEAFPGKTFAARVIELAPEVDPMSRTLQIKLQLENPDPRLKVGMYARVKLITETKADVVKIPGEAVVERMGAAYVYVSKGTTVELRKITLGLSIDGKQEVLTGLKAGEVIVVRGQTLLDDGSKINVIEQVPPLSVQDKVE